MIELLTSSFEKLSKNGKFIFLGMDLLDAKHMQSLAIKIKELGLTIDTCYLSNAKELAEKEGFKQDFYNSIEALGECLATSEDAKGTWVIEMIPSNVETQIKDNVIKTLVRKY